MIYFIAKTVHWVFLTYTMLLFTRIVGSWFPRYAYHPVMRFVRCYSDPYLNIFRRRIPLIAGALDLSPMLGFLALQLLERMILGFLSGLH